MPTPGADEGAAGMLFLLRSLATRSETELTLTVRATYLAQRVEDQSVHGRNLSWSSLRRRPPRWLCQ